MTQFAHRWSPVGRGQLSDVVLGLSLLALATQAIAQPSFTVPPGFRIEVFASVGPNPHCLAFAPAGSEFGADLFVGSFDWSGGGGPDVVMAVSASGVVRTFSLLSSEATPVSLEFAPAGSPFEGFLYVSSNNEKGGGDSGTIQRIDPAGAVTDFTAGGAIPEPTSMSFASGGILGWDLYVGNSSDPPYNVSRVDLSGAVYSFVDAGLCPQDVEFGPGSAFGNDLFVGDACGTMIWRADSSGAVTPFATLPDPPGGLNPAALKFSPEGPFGSDLYVGTGTNIYRVAPDGSATLFASGFLGIGFDGLEFSPDGKALFVADGDAGVVYRIAPDDEGLLSTLRLPQTAISGCINTTGSITLAAPAPAGGLVVSLSSDNVHAVVPEHVTFRPGVVRKSFPIVTSAVAAREPVTIEASVLGQAISGTLTLKPMLPKSVTLSPSSVAGGDSTVGTVTLQCPAGPGDILVTLSSSNPSVATPINSSVLIPAGVKAMPFNVTTTPVDRVRTVSIKAAANGVTRARTLTVNPVP